MKVPNHLGIILDGNRRWAHKHKMKAWMGHKYGVNTFDKFLRWCLELNIPQVSAYVLSTENLNRPKREVNEILKITSEFIRKWINDGDLLDKYEIRVKFHGDFKRLPPTLVKLMNKLMKKTGKYQKRIVNIMIAYGGRFELTRVIKKIVTKVLKSGRIQITQKDVEKNLLVQTPLDLVIRTGGFNRLSNFMLWQASYAEIYTTETLWPDFSKEELIKAIKWFNSVRRNFGR